MVTSTGTFVSCKDYDDDIDRLDQEISNVKDANVPVEVTIRAPNRIALKNFLFIIEKL